MFKTPYFSHLPSSLDLVVMFSFFVGNFLCLRIIFLFKAAGDGRHVSSRLTGTVNKYSPKISLTSCASSRCAGTEQLSSIDKITG